MHTSEMETETRMQEMKLSVSLWELIISVVRFNVKRSRRELAKGGVKGKAIKLYTACHITKTPPENWEQAQRRSFTYKHESTSWLFDMIS